MPNTNLTPQMITNELLRRFKNNLGFSGSISHEYDEKFAKNGAKIGDTLDIREPVRFTAGTGATITPQDVVEKKKQLKLQTQKHVPFQFSSKELTMDIDRFAERYLESAAVTLANAVDVDGLTLAYQATANAVGTPATVPNALKTYLQAGEKLDNNACPIDGMRSVCINPKMQVEIVDALKGLQEAGDELSKQYKRGRMGTAAGFNWMMDQNVRTHQVGPLGGTPLIAGADQVGSSLSIDGWTAAAAARLKKGDVFTIAGVYAVNPVSGDTLSDLQQFTVTANVSSAADGTSTVPVYPELIVTGAYKTVSNSPADNAAITVLGAANALTPTGIAFHRDAFVLGMAPLEIPKGVHFAAKQQDPKTGVSVRMISSYDIINDLFITRCDVLYGWAALRPEWACRIQS
jgi:hypothetical protein